MNMKMKKDVSIMLMLKEEIYELANNHQILLTYNKDEIIEGWPP